jgi:hypothetical protein
MSTEKEREDTLQSQQFSPDFPMFRQIGRTGATRLTPSVRNDKYGRVFIYNPESITIHEYDEMRMDGQVRAGLMLVKLPIQQCRWSIMCEDPDISAFVSEVLKPIWAEFIRNILLALDFGYSVFEKVWSVGYNLRISQTQGQFGDAVSRTYPHAIALANMVQIDPNTCYLLAYRQNGGFAGVRQYIAGGGTIPRNKSFIFTNDCEFQEWYGVSRLKPCYPYWYYKKLVYEWTNIYYETYSVPMKVGRYPVGKTEIGMGPDGSPTYIENAEAMLNILEEMRNNHAVAIPGNRYEDGNFQWDITPFETGRTGGDHLEYIAHLNLMILKSLLVPQLALETGGVGSYSLGAEQIKFFMLSEQALMGQIESALNQQLLPQIVKYNFGPSAPRALFRFQPLNDEILDGLKQVMVQTLGAGQPVPTKDGSALMIDMQWLAETLGVPIQTLQQEEYANWLAADQAIQANAQAQAQAIMAPQGDPSQGGQGGPPQGGGGKDYGSMSGGAEPTQGGAVNAGEFYVETSDGVVCLV